MLQRTMQIRRSSGIRGEARIEARHEGRKVGVRRIERRDLLEPQLFHQTVLKGPVHALDPALRLARIRAQNLDPQFAHGATELGDARTALRLGLRHAEDRVLVGIEGDRASEVRQIALQRLEIGERAFRAHEAKRHQTTGCVVDEHDQRAAGTPILEPAVLAAVDLNQFAKMFAPQARLMKGRRCLRDNQSPSSIIH